MQRKSIDIYVKVGLLAVLPLAPGGAQQTAPAAQTSPKISLGNISVSNYEKASGQLGKVVTIVGPGVVMEATDIEKPDPQATPDPQKPKTKIRVVADKITLH